MRTVQVSRCRDREKSMVTRCANPVCGASFHYLRGGRLFLIDRRERRAVSEKASAATEKSPTAEYFWLCEKCSPELTLIVDGSGRVGVVGVRSRDEE